MIKPHFTLYICIHPMMYKGSTTNTYLLRNTSNHSLCAIVRSLQVLYSLILSLSLPLSPHLLPNAFQNTRHVLQQILHHPIRTPLYLQPLRNSMRLDARSFTLCYLSYLFGLLRRPHRGGKEDVWLKLLYRRGDLFDRWREFSR
jgi:hypothetical protein